MTETCLDAVDELATFLQKIDLNKPLLRNFVECSSLCCSAFQCAAQFIPDTLTTQLRDLNNCYLFNTDDPGQGQPPDAPWGPDLVVLQAIQAAILALWTKIMDQLRILSEQLCACKHVRNAVHKHGHSHVVSNKACLTWNSGCAKEEGKEDVTKQTCLACCIPAANAFASFVTQVLEYYKINLIAQLNVSGAPVTQTEQLAIVVSVTTEINAYADTFFATFFAGYANFCQIAASPPCSCQE